MYTAAAKQALEIAVADKVIVNAVASVLENEGDLFSQQSQRYCVLVERMLRLIAAPWAGADETKGFCLDLLVWNVEQHAFDLPIRGHYVISGIRCLLLAPWSKSILSHSRFAKVLARWAEMAQNRLTIEKCAETKVRR